MPATGSDRSCRLGFRIVASIGAMVCRWVAYRLMAAEVRGLHARVRDLAAESRRRQVTVSHRLAGALIAAEDRRFLGHSGVDPIAVARALSGMILSTQRGGGSTIEQQLVRTITRRYERTLTRKIREVLLATTVGDVASKSDIIRTYLSVAYFGWRMNGVHEACARTGFKVSELTAYQAALVVARLKYPQPRHPSAARRAQISSRAKFIIHVLSSVTGTNDETVRAERVLTAASIDVST